MLERAFRETELQLNILNLFNTQSRARQTVLKALDCIFQKLDVCLQGT